MSLVDVTMLQESWECNEINTAKILQEKEEMRYREAVLDVRELSFGFERDSH
jgi:hypothetical protein